MKTALVTGGSRGIGKAIALQLGKSFNVFVGYSSSKDSGDKVVAEIINSGGTASPVEIDVTNIESIENAFTTIEKEYGGVDVLVNNAGITKDNILPRLKEDDWNDVIDTNLSGSYRTSQRAIKHMMKSKWGRIVYISSIVGMMGNQGQANYAASKAGLIGLSKSIAKEMGSRNITSNVIAPGYIETDMTAFLTDEQKDNIIEQLSIKRIGKPEDIANIVSFLCTDESEYITGQVISVDGGITS
ncbi:MAG: 3-oxoacyl-[acyl-carrier-protein] reductase [Candidatus Actinomarinales bacterium]|nr:MAG: 3-oxoacyl-[acyl-carrier-protein] reductase [Candidatus Actinomarinales bacterium]